MRGPGPGFDELLREAFGPGYLPAHLGLEVVRSAKGVAEVRLPFRPWLRQSFGVVQGGVIATLIDVTMAWAVLSSVHPQQAPTIDLQVNYLRPVVDEDLTCSASIVRDGTSVVTARAEVHTAEALVASGVASFLVRDW